MKKKNWPVVEGDNRPAGVPDRCFYCDMPHGSQHKTGCVIRRRTVVVSATIEYVIDVPEEWDAAAIEFHRNEGSWCSSNGLEEITRLAKRLDAVGECACHITQYKYLREADESDHAANALVQE